MPMAELFDLERHYAFYAAYHGHPANVLVHTLCVWPILLTALLPLRFAPPLFRFHCPLCGEDVAFSLGLAAACAFGGFYALMDRRAGTAAAALCLACWAAGDSLAARLGSLAAACWVVLPAQLLLWSAQFLGHALFEKRRPALVDSPVQALVMAPFFVFLEVLHKASGYEPTPGFYARVRARVAELQKAPAPAPEAEEEERANKAAQEESAKKDL